MHGQRLVTAAVTKTASRTAHLRLLGAALGTVFGIVASAPAWASCTVDTIAECSQSDPAEAERLLLGELAKSSDAGRLKQLGDFYRSAPQQFRNPARARWYLRRAANAGDPAAKQALADIVAGVEPAPPPAVEPPAKPKPPQQRAPRITSQAPAARAEKAPVAVEPAPPKVVVAEAPAPADDPVVEPVVKEPAAVSYDPPSTLAGERASIEFVLQAALSAGFRTEESLVTALGVAIAESALWTAARNWHGERGFRPATDVIGVVGPPESWSGNRQMHSDRGLWQIATWAWPDYVDSVTDDPSSAAAAVFILSRGGKDFHIWDSYASGRAQAHFDRSVDGWPALRPVVQRFMEQEGLHGGDAEVASASPEIVAAESSVLRKKDVSAAAAAIRGIRGETGKLEDLAGLVSVQIRTIGMSTLFDPEISAAITASQVDAASLRGIVRANQALKASLDAARVPVFAVLAVSVDDAGEVTVYVRAAADPNSG